MVHGGGSLVRPLWTRTLGVEKLVSFHTFPCLPFHLHSNPGSLTALVQQSETESDMLCARWLLQRLGLREPKPKHPHRSQTDSSDILIVLRC